MNERKKLNRMKGGMNDLWTERKGGRRTYGQRKKKGNEVKGESKEKEWMDE